MFPARPRWRRATTTGIVLVALVASILVTESPASAATTAQAVEHHDAYVLLGAINTERKAHHLAPLKGNVRLVTSAQEHDLAMAKDNLMSHQVPGEPYFGTRITRAGYKWTYAGENVAWNSDTSQSGVVYLEKLMYDEKAPNDGHRLNILSPNYRNVGISVYLDPVHRKVWLTQDFGRAG